MNEITTLILTIVGTGVSIFGLLYGFLRNFKIDMDNQFEKIEKRFEKIEKRFEKIEERFEKIDGRFSNIEREIQVINTRIAVMESRLNDISTNVTHLMWHHQALPHKEVKEE